MQFFAAIRRLSVASLLFLLSGAVCANTMIEDLTGKAIDGNTGAQYQLGIAYQLGDGVKKDISAAVDWYSRAADNGHMQAQIALAMLYYEGTDLKRDLGKAYKLMYKPASKGLIQAQYFIGRMLENGEGIEKNVSEAMSWYRRSDLGGFDEAGKAIARIEAEREARHQAEIRAQKAAKAKAKAKAIPVSRPALSVQDRLMAAVWSDNGSPANFLPSAQTSCKADEGDSIVCKSDKQQIKVPGITGTYKTKSFIHDIRKDGTFAVTYRNLIIDLDKATQESQGTTLSRGWQNTEHHLECRLNTGNTVSCVKNRTMNMSFSGAPGNSMASSGN